MVLSTQALLVAVGVGTSHAAPMAAALNWCMKDGVGQLGGVLFASHLGKGGGGVSSVSSVVNFDYWRGKFAFATKEKKRKRGNYQRGTADTNPKRWRMVAALALDVSTLLEICTPWMGPEWFLPCASVANIGKNVGFLAASASKAAIHQSLSQGGSSSVVVETEASKSKSTTAAAAVVANTTTPTPKSSNLGDITAKSGSQAIVASLLGTAIGILLSRTFCSDYGTAGILAGFVILSGVHQVCTYRAVKCVPLRSLDRHRLHIVLTSYIFVERQPIGSGGGSGSGHNNDNVKDDKEYCKSMKLEGKGYGREAIAALTPSQVAEKESFLPMVSPDDSVHWLTIGASLMDICPSGASELEGLLLLRQSKNKSTFDDGSVQQQFTNNIDETIIDSPQHYERYILKVHIPSSSSSPSLSSLATSKSDDTGIMLQLTFLQGATDNDILRGMFHAYTAYHYYTLFTKDSSSSGSIINKSNNDGGNNDDYNIAGNQILKETHGIMISQMPLFIKHLREVGWQLGAGFVNVECGSSHRLKIQNV